MRNIVGTALVWVAFLCVEAQTIDELEGQVRSSTQASRPAKRSLYRAYAVACLKAGTPERGLDTLAEHLQGELSSRSRSSSGGPSARRFTSLSGASDAFLVLLHLNTDRRHAALRTDVCEWLFSSSSHTEVFLDVFDSRDDWPQVAAILAQLYDHAGKERDRFRNLIVAMAVVWDQPRRPLHPQIGAHALDYKSELSKRFDHLRRLYGHSSKSSSRGRGRAKIAYEKLSISALTFVVDTPVPVRELRWALDNVRGGLGTWGSKFFDVRYDSKRIDEEQFDWPHGPYTLAEIEDKGGICVDQAYYATLAARAHGIPAMIFSGPGRRGPHAWFAFMKDENEWELDVGRYEYDKYSTGETIDPQSNQPMGDRWLAFTCHRAFRSKSLADASRLNRVGVVYAALKDDVHALRFARRACELVPVYEPAWDLRKGIHRRRKDWEGLLGALDAQAGSFRKFPDVVASVRAEQADLLRQLGREKEAESLLRKSRRRIDNKRDDLAQALGVETVAAMLEKGETRQAVRRLERMLRHYRDEGAKAIPLMKYYLQVTKEVGQSDEAARFLKPLVRSISARYAQTPNNKRVFLGLMLEAYENSGDERRVEKIREEIEELSE